MRLGDLFKWLDRLLIGWVLLGVGIAFCVGFLGLEDEPRLPWFVRAMMSAVPAIETWSHASPNKHHTAIVYATLWALSPGLLYVMASNRERFVSPRFPEYPARTALAGAVFTALILLVAVFGVTGDPGVMRPGSVIGPVSSRFSTGFLGSVIVFFTCFSALITCIAGKRLIETRWRTMPPSSPQRRNDPRRKK